MAYNRFGFHATSIPQNFKLARYALPNSMPEINQLLTALFLVAMVLYLMPAVLRLGGSAERRRWFQRAATAIIGITMAIAVVAALKWFI
ncbi:MAG: hypothetical protein ACLPKT_10275 [Methylocella sp.]